MNYIDYNTLIDDAKKFATSLPKQYYDAVIPIPRSGLIPSAVIAFELDIPALTPNELLEKALFTSNRMHKKQFNDIKRVLVIDDTVGSGKTMNGVKQYLSPVEGIEIEYAALYATPKGRPCVNHFLKILPGPRQFEWNILNSGYVKFAAVDIDGVLCEDPPFWESSKPAGVEQMKKHILNAIPRYIIRYPILALVTNRLERYRHETETWLKNHGITYNHLIMAQYETAQQRRKAGKYGEYKAAAMDSIGARYFIESSIQQSRAIHKASGKPVFCVDTKEFIC